MSIYTRRKDQSQTSLLSGERVNKTDPRIHTVGALDELSAHLGMVKSQQTNTEMTLSLTNIQQNLMNLSALVVATDFDMQEKFRHFADKTTWLENQIDAYERTLPKETAFVLFGGSSQSAAIDVARSVARRCERNLTEAVGGNPIYFEACVYMNRLSDFLYLWARMVDFENKVDAAVEKVMGQNHGGKMTLAFAKKLIEKVEEKAKEMGLFAVVAVCNPEGNPMAVHVMDGAFLVSYNVAMGKAYTAAALKMPTEEAHKLTQPGQPFYGLEALKGSNIVAIAGGVPLFTQGGQLMGALGVSGGTGAQDTVLANFALECFNMMFQ